MEEVLAYFPDISSIQSEQFRQLMPLYTFWNARINVISRKDIDHLYLHHVLHSLSIARIIAFKPGTRIMDAGTGGGFPGIPLAILFPEASFHLVDSIGKKIKVIEQIVRETGLTNVTTDQNRIENVNDRFDFIISRAVAPLHEFLDWCNRKIRPDGTNALNNGILYLKGGDVDEELKLINRPHQVFPIGQFFHEPYFEGKKIVHIAVSL